MIKQRLRLFAERIPLKVYMSLIKRDVLGFYYHVINDKPLPHINHLYKFKTPMMFENDLIYLSKNFNLISYEQLVNHVSNKNTLKKRSVIITFDDGLSECYSIARPLLLKHGIPSIFFISTNFIDNKNMASDLKMSVCLDKLKMLSPYYLDATIRKLKESIGKQLPELPSLFSWIKSMANNDPNFIDDLCEILNINIDEYLRTMKPYMTSDEILRLSQDGFTIGSHSLGHEDFKKLTDYEVEHNIVDSCKVISALIKNPKVPFAFPFNMDGISRMLLREIRNRNDLIGLLFGGGGIQSDAEFVVSRMCGDDPSCNDHRRSNLNHRLKSAYIEEISELSHGNQGKNNL